MSAYLMSDNDTILIAAYAAHHKLAPNAARAATTLRSANNDALKARYGDNPVPLLRGVSKKLATLNIETTTPYEFYRIVCAFAYQCCEGDVWETHPGAALLRRIQQHAANVLHAD